MKTKHSNPAQPLRGALTQTQRDALTQKQQNALTQTQRSALEARYRKAAREYITARVAYYEPIIGVTHTRLSIRDQKTRWGSCSSRGGLNFNWRLMLAPPRVLDYVVVHELCHRKEMNHSKAFWHAVETVLPDYRELRKWLRENGNTLVL
ncbi:MAG: M48 family metallopeptidase [Lachnospiraceae bacterium]|nr:M48 family metallopeptidase [Lachnospiraceae bacterium]